MNSSKPGTSLPTTSTTSVGGPRSARILALGEVLWDVFADGPRFGGAPANFACACAGLGRERVQVALATAVGRDELGNAAIQRLGEAGVLTTLVWVADDSVAGHPTGEVHVILDAQGLPRYRFVEDPAWDFIPWGNDLGDFGVQADLICFGTLAQRNSVSRQTIQRVLTDAAREKPAQLRIVDINLRSPFWDEEIIRQSFTFANILKLNDEELPIVARILGLDGSEEVVLAELLRRYRFRLIALTRGSRGSSLITSAGERDDRPGVPIDVIDTVGAGDAFTAVIALGLLHGLPLDRLHPWASKVAAFVCTQAGGTPRYPPHLGLAEVLKDT